MATCRQVITSALRKVGVVNEGATAPPAYDMATGLEVLQAWYDGAISDGLFGRLNDVTIEADYDAQEFDRILNITDGELDVTLPVTVDDPCTGETRVPLDLVPIVAAQPGEAPSNYIYDATAGDWVNLTGLTLDDEAPLSLRGRDGLACVLAVQLADEFGYEIGQITVGRATRFLGTITQRNGSARRAVAYEYM